MGVPPGTVRPGSSNEQMAHVVQHGATPKCVFRFLCGYLRSVICYMWLHMRHKHPVKSSQVSTRHKHPAPVTTRTARIKRHNLNETEMLIDEELLHCY